MRTLKQEIRKITKKDYKILYDYSKYSNNLYNYSLYFIRQFYFNTNKYIGLKELEKEVKNNENYKLLPSQSAQQILKLVDKNFRSFFALLRKKKNGQYHDKINIPKYKEKNGLFNIIFTNQNAILKNNMFNLCKSITYKRTISNRNLTIPFSYNLDGKFKQLIIKPFNNGKYFKMYIIYEENKKNENYDLNKNNYLSIDLGIDNFASCVDTSGHSFIMNGKPLKSYNRWYNKELAKKQSILKILNNKNISNYLQKLFRKRENFIDNYMNQIVNKIIKKCIEYKNKNIVLGYNKGWKNKINMGKKNNQKFVQIPYLNFIKKIESKCNIYNINLILQEESYTSKCSFINKEKIKKHDKYLGKRIKRGLYKSKEGILINADINAAGNILRKVIGDVFINQPILGLMLNPVKLNFN